MKSSKILEQKRGFTLIEIVVVVAILAVISAIAYPRVTDQINNSRVSTVIANLQAIDGASSKYFLQKGAYATTLDTLVSGNYLSQTPAVSGNPTIKLFDVDYPLTNMRIKNGRGVVYVNNNSVTAEKLAKLLDGW